MKCYNGVSVRLRIPLLTLRNTNNWLIFQNFYNGLSSTSRAHTNAAAGGAFFSLTVNGATALNEKMVSNQGLSEDKLQTQEDGRHTMEETDMLAAKLDLNKMLGQTWYHPITLLAYTMQAVWKL